MSISIQNLAESKNLIGSSLGRTVYQKVMEIIQSNPHRRCFQISMLGISCTDATFARESILALAKAYRGIKAFCLIDLSDQDQIDNWSYAADCQGQPLMSWAGKNHKMLGCQMTSSGIKIVEYAIKHDSVTAANVSNEMSITIHNASTTLKRLHDQGYLMRTETPSCTGGIEFIYQSICPSRN